MDCNYLTVHLFGPLARAAVCPESVDPRQDDAYALSTVLQLMLWSGANASPGRRVVFSQSDIFFNSV